MGGIVEIKISKDGVVSCEASGFTGASCEDATEFLNNLFTAGEVKHKNSYYETEVNLTDPLPSGFCG